MVEARTRMTQPVNAPPPRSSIGVPRDTTPIGRAVSVQFEPSTYRITHVEVSPELYSGNYLVPMEWIREFRREAIVLERVDVRRRYAEGHEGSPSGEAIP